MKLKTIFLLGDIGFLNLNLRTSVNLIRNQIDQNDIVTILGDNFYPSGVSGLDDPLWNNYNDIFKEIKNPVYSILGNHDYQQNPTAQVFSENWEMGGYYFKKEFDNIDLYFLDTNQFNLEWAPEEILKKVHNLDSETLIKNQLNWLETEFNKDKSKNKLVFGHYPIITNGRYFDKMQKLYDDLIEIFKKYNVKTYISGHEHNVQYLNRKIDNLDFSQIIIGSSSESRYDAENCYEKDMLDNRGNFFGKLILFDNKMKIQYIDKNNKIRHEYDINF